LSNTIVVRGLLAKRVREKAEKLRMSIKEYIVELISQGLDPRDKADEYVKVAEDLLREACEEMRKGGVKQAAEKIWVLRH